MEEDGYVLIDIGSRSNARKHTVSTSVQSDGSTRVVCYSNNNNTFSGETGDILTITQKADNNIAAGTYNLQLRNITLSRTNVTGLTLEDYNARISVIPTGIENDVDNENLDDSVYSLSGQKVLKPRKGINIINGRKVVVK